MRQCGLEIAFEVQADINTPQKCQSSAPLCPLLRHRKLNREKRDWLVELSGHKGAELWHFCGVLMSA